MYVRTRTYMYIFIQCIYIHTYNVCTRYMYITDVRISYTRKKLGSLSTCTYSYNVYTCVQAGMYRGFFSGGGYNTRY